MTTPESPRNRSRTLDSTSSSGSTEIVTIESLLADIVHDQLGLHGVDLSQIVQKFHDNWIYELKILQTLEREHIVRLQLPIALEAALLRLLPKKGETSVATKRRRESKPSKQNSTTHIPKEGLLAIPEKAQKLLGESQHKFPTAVPSPNASALLGLTPETRQLIKDSWAIVSSKTPTKESGETPLNRFFDECYKQLFELDKHAKSLFDGAPMRNQANNLMRTMLFLVQAIDNPIRLIIPLKRLGVRHLIYGVERRSFQLFGIAVAKAMDACLGAENVAVEVKEAWYVLIQALGELMVEDYDDIRTGYSGSLWRKESGGKWRRYFTILTHEKLALFSDEDQSKLKEEYYLSLVDDIDAAVDELPKGVAKHTPYCFMIKLAGAHSVYFCCDNDSELLSWAEDLTIRIRAHQRVARSDEHNALGVESWPPSPRSSGSSSSSETDQEAAIQRAKRLRLALKKG